MSEGGKKMGRRHLAIKVATLLLFVFPVTALGADGGDTETRMVNAEVVEVTEHRISIIAQTGVEHVIAIDDANTKVTLKGKSVALKDLRKGDVVTVELDELNPLKFAKQINIATQSGSELATAVP